MKTYELADMDRKVLLNLLMRHKYGLQNSHANPSVHIALDQTEALIKKLEPKKVQKFGWVNVSLIYDGPHDTKGPAEEAKRRNGGLVMYATWEEEV